MVSEKVTAITPGKAILFGEHFVIYDYSSIIFAINKDLEITICSKSTDIGNRSKKRKNSIKIFSNLGFDIQIVDNKLFLSNNGLSPNHLIIKNLYKIIQFLINDNKNDFNNQINEDLFVYIRSDIPIGGGLGSSSALCVSITGAFYDILKKKLNKELLCKKSIELERTINPNTSGVDCNICTFGGLGIYDKSNGFRRLEYDIRDLQFLIVDTGIHHNTFALVNKVKKIREKNIEHFEKLCQEYKRIFEFSLESLKKNDLKRLGLLMDDNHALLKSLTLSNSIIEKIVKICRRGGTFGTKITGSGGGGCIISLLNKDEGYSLAKVLKGLDDLRLCYYFVNLDNYGFRLENRYKN